VSKPFGAGAGAAGVSAHAGAAKIRNALKPSHRLVMMTSPKKQVKPNRFPTPP
jgi:hypothetical protein